MIAIGVDPGTYRTGFGIVRRDGGRLVRLGSGLIEAEQGAPLERRLLAIYEGLSRALTSFAPEQAAVENVFVAKNAKTSLDLGHVRGVLLLALVTRGIPITSYTPAFVKRALVGTGRADKGQMRHVVQAILGLKDLPQEDEGDALAVAICHLNGSPIALRR